MTGDAMQWTSRGQLCGTTDPGGWTTVGQQRDRKPKVSLVRRRCRVQIRDGRLRDVLGRESIHVSHPFTAWDTLTSGTRPWDRADG